MIRRPPRSTHCISSAASDVYKRQGINAEYMGDILYCNKLIFQNKFMQKMNESQKADDEFLRSTMKFTKFAEYSEDQSEFQIFKLVQDGKITEINKKIQELTQANKQSDIYDIVNRKDKEGKTPLHYACYYNFTNLVMYLPMKKANPYERSSSNKNCFHITCYKGHLESVEIIINHEKLLQFMDLMQELKSLMKKYNIKKTDVNKGQLICSDKHVAKVQANFQIFQEAISQLTIKFLKTQVENFLQSLATIDEHNRNPLHYAALDKYTKSILTIKYLLNYELQMTNIDKFVQLYNEVQLLETNKEKRQDPRQYLDAFKYCEHFLLPDNYKEIMSNFREEFLKARSQIINAQDSEGYSTLHLASYNGAFKTVQYLLSIGGNPKLVDAKNSRQVLDYADTDNVRKYLIDLKDAARKGDTKSLNMLVNCGHQINEKKTIFGIAPIHNSIENYHKTHNDESLKYIISCNADIDISDSNGWTPLHYACEKGEINVVKLLIQNKTNIHKFSNKGYQPIHIAALNDQAEIIEELIKRGANIEALDNQKCTPLILASKKGFTKSMEMLLKYKANIYAADQRDWTSLHFAAFNYQKKAVHLLCRWDADNEKLKLKQNTKGQTAHHLNSNPEIQFAFHTLWSAAAEGNLDIVRRLVSMGENIDEQTIQYKYTPLILAVKNEHYLVVRFLLESGANIMLLDNRKIDKDDTTLQHTAQMHVDYIIQKKQLNKFNSNKNDNIIKIKELFVNHLNSQQ
eukprot:TRINITY_DN2230_c0_g1_i3.p1 TRINITY_DN2230_c0_g1~~TRINITY_DN2230_c0_g1_i3.p1  ORF type:complete len:744 (-),score=143.38 TRINITY_DN2230_c0_g1_i3:71-2302(-)